MDNNISSISFAVVAGFILAIDYLLGSKLLHIVGWVYLLPNHNYLYIFAILPLVTLILVSIFYEHIAEWAIFPIVGLLLTGGVVYFLAGGAQLWRAPIIPLGLLPMIMGFKLVKEAILLSRNKPVPVLYKTFGILLGSLILIAASTIYVQPWNLVAALPNVSNADFSQLDLRNTNLNLVKFTSSNLEEVDFTGASLIGIDFKEVNLKGARFNGAIIENSKFNGAILTGADFSNARIYQTSFDHSDMRLVVFEPRSVGRTYITNSRLCGVSFGNLGEGIYGWSGSTVDTGMQIPKGADVKISKNEHCTVNP